MSVHLYPQRIYWDGRAGCLRNLPFKVELSAPPVLPGCVLQISEIDYAPGTVAQLREHAGPMREMRPDELAACEALLRSLRGDADVRQAETDGERYVVAKDYRVAL